MCQSKHAFERVAKCDPHSFYGRDIEQADTAMYVRSYVQYRMFVAIFIILYVAIRM